MKLIFLFTSILLLPFALLAQVKEAFQQQLAQERQKNTFGRELLQLDSVFKKDIDTVAFYKIKTAGKFDYVSFKTVKSSLVVVLDIIPLWAETFMQMEREGKINVLKRLRAEGKLKLTSRVIANEVELPKKTNNNQSYNDFYLGVIRQLMAKNKALLAPDQLDFTAYKEMEKEENLHSDQDIQEFRAAFIIFLYSHYHIK